MNLPLIRPEQLIKFASLASKPPTTWGGSVPMNWANKISPGLGETHGLPTKIINRSELMAIWQDTSCSTEKAFLSTMSWGKMKLDNGRRIWANRKLFMPKCEKIRAGSCTRSEAFDMFRCMRLNNELPGMGPAYYTKILFFANQSLRAYILDQWTARSIHMLTMQRYWPSMQIDYTTKKKAEENYRPQALRASVTDRVTKKDYEWYCQLVEDIAREINLTPQETEERMFGIGGKVPSLWRKYVMENWQSLPTSKTSIYA